MEIDNVLPAKDIGWLSYSVLNAAFLIAVWWADAHNPGVQFWGSVPASKVLLGLFCVLHAFYWISLFVKRNRS